VIYKLFIFLSFVILGNVQAKEITMAFSKDIPPYIFETKNKGIEIDIISTALAYKGHTLKPAYFPLGRVPFAFISNFVDAAMGDIGKDLLPHGGHYAKPAVIYHNIFITRADSHITITKPQDLIGLNISSFQGAQLRYPQWLNETVASGHFHANSNQLSQIKKLLNHKVDVVLSDRYIFKYFAKQLRLEQPFKPTSFVEHEFVKVNPKDYRAVFRSEKIRDDFNEGLQHMYENGQVQKIYDNYLK
jgi:polar amino acid transport system substrate-binding protein